MDRGIALSFRDLGTKRGCVISITPRPLYPGKDPVPIVQEARKTGNDKYYIIAAKQLCIWNFIKHVKTEFR
jgi:hypothetical protein